MVVVRESAKRRAAQAAGGATVPRRNGVPKVVDAAHAVHDALEAAKKTHKRAKAAGDAHCSGKPRVCVCVSDAERTQGCAPGAGGEADAYASAKDRH